MKRHTKILLAQMVATMALTVVGCFLINRIVFHATGSADMIPIFATSLSMGWLCSRTIKYASQQWDKEAEKIREELLKQIIKVAPKMNCEMTIRSLSYDTLKIEASWCDTNKKACVNIQCDPAQVSIATLFSICEQARVAGERRENEGMV